MEKVCESREDDSWNLFSHSDDENLDQNNINEEQQKIFKNIISEFKKNKNNKDVKKLYNSSNIKKVPNYFNKNNKRNNKYLVNNKVNNDGTIDETKIEKMENGQEKIIKTRYDKNHNVISRKIFYNDKNISNNNNNNNNINNNNFNRGNIYRAPNGFTIETKIETLPNGKKNEIKTIRDENNIVVDIQEDEIIENNGPNYIPNNVSMPPPQMNYMGYPHMNNYIQNPSFMQNNNNMYNIRNNINMNNDRSHNPRNPMNINMFNANNVRRNNYNLNNINYMNNMNNMNNINYMNNMNNLNNMNYMNNVPMPMPLPMPMPMMNNYGFPPMGMMIPMPMPVPIRIGVDPNILNSLPETEVNDSEKLDPDNKNCVICLEDFKDKERIICLPCIHVFHSECIKSWLSKNDCCPTCKYELTYQNLNSNPH